MFEAPGLSVEVVGAAASFEVLVMGTSVEYRVAIHGGVSGVRVIGHFVAAQDVSSVVNFRLAMQFVDGTNFFLAEGDDGRLFLVRPGRSFPRSRGLRWSTQGKQLAGNYAGSE